MSIAWEYTNESNDIIQDKVVIPASFSRVAMPANAQTSISTRVPTNAPTLATASPSRFPTVTPSLVPTNASTPVPTGACFCYGPGGEVPVFPWSSSTTYTTGNCIRINDQKYACYVSSGECNQADTLPSTNPDVVAWRSFWNSAGICS